MAKTAILLTEEEMAVYRATARQREKQQHRERAARAERAWTHARRAAELLKAQFGARRVIVFGSLTQPDFFHRRSDVDLAVEGIASRDFWRAWSALDILGFEFEIDLIDVETAPPALCLAIEQQGVEL